MRYDELKKIINWAKATLGESVAKKLKIKDLKWLKEMHAEYTA
jgi:hypothetical protein